MTDETRETGLEFPINQQLLEDATRAREEWRVMRDRLARIDQNKGQVTAAVYERVRSDYESRLKEATSALMTRKDAVERELVTLRETRRKITTQLEGHQQNLEEIKFRNTLGEYTEEQYQGLARTEQDKIAKFETVIGAVDMNLHRYESLFDAEREVFAPAEPLSDEEVSNVAEISGITPLPHASEPVTDDRGFVIDEHTGPDYFAAEPAAESTSPAADDGATEKEIGTPREPIEASPRRSRVVIISGEEAGAAYPIKGTLSFGRAESNTVVLKDAKVSRQHAQIQQQGSEYILIDLNSSNGTFVNTQRIEEHVLANGDEILIGDFLLQFQT